MTEQKNVPERDPSNGAARLLQDMNEWKQETERRLRRLEAAVDVIQLRRQLPHPEGT